MYIHLEYIAKYNAIHRFVIKASGNEKDIYNPQVLPYNPGYIYILLDSYIILS